MKKTMRKLIPGVIMLLISAMLVGTSTYAWFSMNTKVTVTGMNVTTKVSSNLLIAEDTLDSTAKKADNLFGSTITTELSSVILEPVSTKDGKAFFYTTNAKKTGDANADDYAAYNAAEVPTAGEITSFQNAYSSGATGIGYKDYVFQLSAVNTTTGTVNIEITKLDLVYGKASDPSLAYRVAVFVEDITSANPAGGSGTLTGIYSPNGAANFSDAGGSNYAVGAAATAPSALTNNYNAAAGVLTTVPANSTKYFKVVMRLYLEGEDTTCNNTTFQALDGTWRLNVEMVIDQDSSVTPISYLGKYTHAQVSTTDYWYNGTGVWTNQADLGDTGAASYTAIGSADAAVQTAFGYVAP